MPAFLNEFASVFYDHTEGVFWVIALRPAPFDGEFSEIVQNCEIMYNRVRDKFILALNLRKMEKIGVGEALQWMAMFFRVMPITKEHLRFTCACFDGKLQEHVDKFLELYNPVRPFHTFSDEDEFKEYVAAHA